MMLRKKFYSLVLVLCILLSTAGIYLVTPGTVAAAPDAFVKQLPENDATVYTSTITLRWEAASGAVRYEYCLFTKPSCPPGQYKSAGARTSVTLTVKPGTTYHWQVRARASDGTYTYANGKSSWTFRTGSAAPSAFYKSTPTSGQSNQSLGLQLTWTASTGINVNYQVCYDTTNNNTCDNNVWRLAGASNTYSPSGLVYNTIYYWQVRAYNSKGTVYANSGSWWNFRTRIAPPTPFSKLSPAHPSTGMPVNLNLVWSPSTGTNLIYQYCVDEVDNNSCDTSWTPTSNTYAAPAGLQYMRTYYWQVRAVNNNGADDPVQSNEGAWWRFTTLDSAPQGFTKVLPIDGAGDVSLTPILYWSYNSLTSLTFQYCLVLSGQPCTNWTNAGSNTYARITMPRNNDAAYIWQVRSTDSLGNYTYANGAEGATWTFNTLPLAPQWIPPDPGFSTPEDPTTPYIGQLNATNPAHKTLTYTLSGSAPAGTFSLNPDGQFSFTPEPNFHGSVTFNFTIWDGVNNPSGPFTATIDVSSVNDLPVIVPFQNIRVPGGSDIFFTIETSDADLMYGDSLTLNLIGTLPSGATFTVSKDLTTGAVSGDFEWLGAEWTSAHPGKYAFTAELTDSDNALAQYPFTVEVVPNILYVPFNRKQ